VLFLVLKLNDHRLKPGGVPTCSSAVSSFEVEVPPAKAGGVRRISQ